MAAAGSAAIAVGYGAASDRFAGLLPDLLGRFSLVAAFQSFAADHVFDLAGLLLYLSPVSYTHLDVYKRQQIGRVRLHHHAVQGRHGGHLRRAPGVFIRNGPVKAQVPAAI